MGSQPWLASSQREMQTSHHLQVLLDFLQTQSPARSQGCCLLHFWGFMGFVQKKKKKNHSQETSSLDSDAQHRSAWLSPSQQVT